jgi:hypothetical protein
MPVWLIVVLAVGAFGFCCTLGIALGLAAKLGDEVLDRALRERRKAFRCERRVHHGSLR